MTPVNTVHIPYRDHQPGLKAMLSLHGAVQNSPLERPLVELVRTRASQINGCAYCIDMHTKDAMAAGETPQRLLVLSAWEDSPFYDRRERAALRLTEAVTLLAAEGVPDDVLDECHDAFTDAELASLLYAIVEINAWNRLAVAGRAPVGDYQPAAPAPAT